MAVLSMSKQEFSRLDVLLRVQSGRLRVADACALMGRVQHTPKGRAWKLLPADPEGEARAAV
jgi:hypothetical protein